MTCHVFLLLQKKLIFKVLKIKNLLFDINCWKFRIKLEYYLFSKKHLNNLKCIKNIFGSIVPGKLRRNWGGFSTHANRSAIWLTTSDNMNEQVGSWFFFISGAILCNQTLQIGAISSIWLWASNDLHLQTRLKIREFQNYVDGRSI